MKKYIEKQDAIDAILRGGITDGKELVDIWEIERIPAADVASVVHGYWIRHDDADIVEGYYVPEYECSKCRAWKKDDSDFCPDCGARMDGGKL